MGLDSILILSACGIIIILLIALLSRKNSSGTEKFERTISELQRINKEEIITAANTSVQGLGSMVGANQRMAAQAQNERLEEINKSLLEKQDITGRATQAQLSQMENRLKTFSTENEQKLENIRSAVEKRLTYLQEDNNKKLDEIRQIVDEKLQKTLEERMTQSFRLVNERLEQVYKGLGEMQTLAVGVGDLKKVLTNVKTKGMLGEIQLGAILEEILSKEQYVKNAKTKADSNAFVEYAVKIPTEDDKFIFLPIDSKFPAEVYSALVEAMENGSREQIELAGKELDKSIKSSAKEIRDKYIDPPNTTEFGILFLPTEGLYAEAVRRGLIEILQREYRINISGPSTMAALLNSLQMGFRSFAIQKRSGEVWEVLRAVKTEFDTFEDVLKKTQQRLYDANAELDKLIGVRTRQIQRRLRNVATLSLPAEETPPIGDEAMLLVDDLLEADAE